MDKSLIRALAEQLGIEDSSAEVLLEKNPSLADLVKKSPEGTPLSSFTGAASPMAPEEVSASAPASGISAAGISGTPGTGQKTLLGAIQSSGTTPSPAPTAGMPTSISAPVTTEAEAEKPEDTLLARLRKAEETRGEERKRADVGQVAEMVGRSLAQIGAAQQGMKAGVDMSGVGQAKGIDWAARRAEIADDYKTELASISKEREQLLEKEKRALEAGNQKELLDIKKKEYKLLERKTNADIEAKQAERDAVRASIGKPDSKMVAAADERAAKTMEKLDASFDKIQTINTSINDFVSKIVQDKKDGKSTTAAEKAAITTYLKGLDPDSAVLAAEQLAFVLGGTKEDLLNSLRDNTLGDYLTDTVLGRITEAKLAGLQESANLKFSREKQAYNDRVKKTLRAAYESGSTNPMSILGRAPLESELDEVTSKAWKSYATTATDTTAPVPTPPAGPKGNKGIENPGSLHGASLP